MMTCEGYKMFRGTMRINPVNNNAPFTVSGTWLYKPDVDTWYCGGSSFPADVCDIEEDETE